MNEDAINENHISPKSSVVEEKNNRKKPNKPKKPKNTKPFKKHKILKTGNKPVKKRKKAGVKALQDIKKYQRDVKNLIPKSAFKRLVQEIIQDQTTQVNRVDKKAIEALQEACEAYLV